MRIGIDVQTLETHERYRGIGKLCARTVRLLAEAEPGHDILLFGRNSEPGEAVAPLLSPNVSYCPILTEGNPEDLLSSSGAAPFLWSTPEGRTLDVYHVTSPLMFDILLPVSSPCPVAATLLDAIPAVMQARGTPLYDEPAWQRYEERVGVLGEYQAYLPISTSAADDCAAHLALSQRRMHVTYVPIEQRPLAGLDDAAARARISRFGLEPGYVVSVSGYHARKNLDGMMRSYARLPAGLRRKAPLVLVCALTSPEEAELRGKARELGIEKEFRTTGYVTDEELVALVRCAGCMFFPSRYEGFGIPPAEAMACGTPVVAANTSSLPEILGEAGVLIDPDAEDAFAGAMERLLTDAPFRAERVALGFRQVEQFAPERYLDRLLAGYKSGGLSRSQVAAPEEPKTGFRIALFASDVPAVAGVPELEDRLALSLAAGAEVDWFTPRVGDMVASSGQLPVLPAAAFEGRHRVREYDALLYVLGPGSRSAGMLPFAEAHPGVAVVQSPHGLDHTRVLHASRAVVVDSEHARAAVLAQGIEPQRVHVIRPGGSKTPTDGTGGDSPRIRRRWLLAPGTFVVLFLGEVKEQHDSAAKALEAFEKFHRTEPNSALLFVGGGERTALQRLFAFSAQARLKHCVRVLGARCEREIRELVSVADVCLCLSEEGRGRTSATAWDVLSAGRPLLVSQCGGLAELPDSVCWKVRPGALERQDLLAYFRHLREDPESGRKLGQGACQFAANRTWEDAAAEYSQLLRTVAHPPA